LLVQMSNMDIAISALSIMYTNGYYINVNDNVSKVKLTLNRFLELLNLIKK